jgi:hypothetical protein
MAPSRRRTRTGVPIAVFVALLAVAISSRANRERSASTSPAVAPTASSGTAASRGAAPASASPRVSPAAAPAAKSGSASRGSSPGFASRQRLVEHYDKHGAEFPGLSLEQYLGAAQTLRDAPISATVLEVRRADGVVTRFDRTSGAFLAANRDGTIRTFFRPNDGEAYFRRQARRTPGGGT